MNLNDHFVQLPENSSDNSIYDAYRIALFKLIDTNTYKKTRSIYLQHRGVDLEFISVLAHLLDDERYIRLTYQFDFPPEKQPLRSHSFFYENNHDYLTATNVRPDEYKFQSQLDDHHKNHIRTYIKGDS